MIYVLFVCLGNICRSPMAEAVFKKHVADEDLADVISIDSAGTASWHVGKPPHEGTTSKLKEYDISTDGQACRQLIKKDFEKFDYIIGMDESNIKDIRQMLGEPTHPKIIRLLDLTDHQKDLPDPYYTGDFQETYDLVSDGCKALLAIIKKDHLSQEKR